MRLRSIPLICVAIGASHIQLVNAQFRSKRESSVVLSGKFKDLCKNGFLNDDAEEEMKSEFLLSRQLASKENWYESAATLGLDMGSRWRPSRARWCLRGCNVKDNMWDLLGRAYEEQLEKQASQGKPAPKAICRNCIKYIPCESGTVTVAPGTIKPPPKRKLKNGEFICGRRGLFPQPRIFGGTAAEKKEFPWQISIRSQRGDNTCGGSVINREWVLTAAHCVTTATRRAPHPISLGKYKYIAIGFHENKQNGGDLSKEQRKGGAAFIEVAETIVHEDWSFNTALNDIALLRLKSEIQYPERPSHVVPVCLPSKALEKRELIENASECVITGWGQTETSGSSKTLLKATVHTYNEKSCERDFSDNGQAVDITNRQICGENKNTESIDTCSGDSGGPLQCPVGSNNITASSQIYQAGITSWGIKCASGTPGVYTRVSEYIDWIEAKLEKHSVGQNYGIQVIQ